MTANIIENLIINSIDFKVNFGRFSKKIHKPTYLVPKYETFINMYFFLIKGTKCEVFKLSKKYNISFVI